MKLLLLFFLCIITITAHAQQECGTALDRASKSYEIGNFNDAIAQLTPCLENGFSSDEKWQAYRLLALAYIFKDDAPRADSMIRKMLESNPRYEPNVARDPIEFRQMMARYSSFARFRAGIKGGLGYGVNANASELHRIAGNHDAVEHSSLALNVDVGALFDVNLTSTLALSIETLYATRGYSSTGEHILTFNTNDYTEQLTYLNLPLMVKYQFGEGSIRPYLYAGGFVGVLSGAQSTLNAALTIPGDSVHADSTRSFNLTRIIGDKRSQLNYGVVVGAGLFYQLGDGLLMLDLRSEYGLKNIVSANPYADPAVTFPYLHADNGFKLRNIAVSLGYVYQFGYTFSSH